MALALRLCLTALCVALLFPTIDGVQRKDVEDTDVAEPAEALAQQAQQNAAPAKELSPDMKAKLSPKLPKHLAQYYASRGFDNVVHFSFCIA